MARARDNTSNGSASRTASTVCGHESVIQKFEKPWPPAPVEVKRFQEALGENAVSGVGGHLGGAESVQELLTLDQGGTGLYEIVHDNDVAPDRFAFLELDDALGAFADFGADDALVTRGGEEGVESLVRSLIWVRDDDVVRVFELVQTVEQERYAAFEAWQDAVAEIKSLLKSVNIENNRARRAPRARAECCSKSAPTSPRWRPRPRVPLARRCQLEKNGSTSVNDATNILGSEYMMLNCSKMTSGV